MIEFVECDFCEEEFIKGNGHTCWCAECRVKHPMCNECYIEAKKNDQIRDISVEKSIYNNKTLRDHK